MARERNPRVSIGLPVYNGQAFVRAAIESILNQTFTDLELIICDNASADATEAICREYAQRDSRVRYIRNETNLGAAPNFNRAFELARGEYFKWAAADDQLARTYIEQCVEALDTDRGAILAHSRAGIIDHLSRPIRFEGLDQSIELYGEPVTLRKILDAPRDLNSPDVAIRLREVLVRTRWCFEVFGLIRADVLRKTPLHLSFYGSDKVLLAALALIGRFIEIPQELFFRRYHQGQSSSKPATERATFMNARSGGWSGLVPAQVKCGAWYAALIAQADLEPGDRMRCVGEIFGWAAWLAKLVYRQRHKRGVLHRVLFSRMQQSTSNNWQASAAA